MRGVRKADHRELSSRSSAPRRPGRTFRPSSQPNVSCVVQLVPGKTTYADVDRNGDTGINDFLTLLGGWGPCPK